MVAPKICLIAPYGDLVQAAQRLNEERKLGLIIREGLLEEGIRQAEDAVRAGIQLIISRGGTATIIREHIDVPVVEIKVTGYDVFRVLAPERGAKAPLGVVGYHSVVEGCRQAAEILGLPIEEFIIETNPARIDWKEIRSQVRSFIERYGIKVVVGDTLVLGALHFGDVDMRLITSGAEAILQAYDEASHLLRVLDEEKRQAQRFRAVLDSVHDGVIAVDDAGRITVINPVAEEVLKISGVSAVGKPLKDFVPNTRMDYVLRTGDAETAQLQRLGNITVVTNRVPIVVDGRIRGAVATFQEVKKLQDAEQKIRKDLYAKGLTTKYTFRDILTGDELVKRLIRLAQEFARTNATVLIQGESGTGKELFAQAIHAASPRNRGPFVAINCSALPSQLLESELFGYVEGAFTGAKKEGKPGLFELAHGGTIFLDEIGDMSKDVQTRILRVLEERRVMRIGSDSYIPVDIRVIAATNIDLRAHVREGCFRLDLFYRLNVLNLYIPPLRKRTADILLLARHFAKQYCEEHGKQPDTIPPEVFTELVRYDWPGNIRELKNVMERISLFSDKHLTRSELELLLQELSTTAASSEGASPTVPPGFLAGTMEEIKRAVVQTVLSEEGGNKTKAARRLGVDRATVDRLS